MRTLVMHLNDDGARVCSIVTHETEFDPTSMDTLDDLYTKLKIDGITALISLPEDDFVPTVIDASYNEVPIQKVELC